MLGVPVKGATLLFGDNESMVKNVTLPQSTLKKRHNAIAYHKVRQAVAAGFVGIVHCRSEHNLADWGTNARCQFMIDEEQEKEAKIIIRLEKLSSFAFWLGIHFRWNHCMHDPFWIVSIKPLGKLPLRLWPLLRLGPFCGPLVHRAS